MSNNVETSTRVAKIVRAAPEVAAELPESERGLFRDFVQAVAKQVRAPFVARHGAEGTVRALLPLFRCLAQRTGDSVHVEAEPRGEDSLVVRTCMPDQPFIVDTVRLMLAARGAVYENGVNAVMPVTRDEDGRLTSVGGAGRLESVLQIEASKLGPEVLTSAQAALESNLRLAQAMVRDFTAMSQTVERAATLFNRVAARIPSNAEAYREAADFMTWLLADNFVFMGTVSGDDRLGFERVEGVSTWAPADTASWGENPLDLPVHVHKGAVESPVHRSGQIDEILVRLPDEAGNPSHELVLRGMFTYRAVTQPSRNVPILRRVLGRILRQEESRPGSWRYKGVANVFDSLPTEYLFTANFEEIAEMVDRVLDAEAEQEVRVHLSQNAASQMVFFLAAMPRVQYSDRLRRRMEATLKGRTSASYSDHGLFVSRYETVLAYFYLTGAKPLSAEELSALHADLGRMATPWEDGLYEALVAEHGDEQADALITRYGQAFGEEFTAHNPAARAASDIGFLEQLSPARPIVADLFLDEKGRPSLRLYQLGNLILSEMLPVLDNFGLLIYDQYSDPIHPRRGDAKDIDTFRIQGVNGLTTEQLLERKALLVEALEAVFAKKMPDDSLNRLLLAANIPWKDVDLIRAYRGYARQIGLTLTLPRIQEILLNQAGLVSALVGYFHARFNPSLDAEARKDAMAASAEVVDAGLRRLRAHDEDMLLRLLFNLMQSSMRTNYYRDDKRAHYLSFKVQHNLVSHLPEPRMKVEIYVHHNEMEGLHLRGGSIARGGIRWSDRSDFRTEILDLVRTQMVKNVVIVPEGAKGGFFLKHAIPDAKVRRVKADELYRFLVRGLLDLTDNYVQGKIVRPPNVVAHDGDDPYLVVAADKGTAHLSDTANRISVDEYGFWLGDAFASGGSQGYDHKVVGITARGAWECVDRHFAEMGLDPKKQTFTCIGIGDTGGDVFGNGVIQYPTMKLLAAFNHVHIFLDPDPDAAKSYTERRRLFDAVRGWDDYDRSLISEGGGVFDRSAKSIPLSPQVKKMLGVLQDELPTDAVIRLILRMQVDLLWNGGIGTYFKASTESHADAGDATNDSLRVNANELRCRVVGEGGNLGFTQAGRVEFALLGGRLNTDAVDNSGGVDTSDHEVNLKILLSPMVASGELTYESRNALIKELTDEVAQAVLANNATHARQLSLDQLRSARDPLYYSRAIQWVCQRSGASRDFLRLPSDEVLRQRGATGKGLVRPELAVLQAHVKLHVYKALLDGDSAHIPSFNERLLNYFPAKIRATYPEQVSRHMLAKAIGMTVVLTDVVADNGAAFFPTLQDLTGRHPAEIAGAYLRAAEAFDLAGLRVELREQCEGFEGRYASWVAATDGVQGLLGVCLAPGEATPSAEEFGRIKAILVALRDHRGHAETDRAAERVNQLAAKGVRRDLAERVASFADLTLAREIALSQVRTGESDRDAVVRYLSVGQASGVLRVVRAIEERRTVGSWDPIAMGILRSRYSALLRRLLDSATLDAKLSLDVDGLARRLRSGELAAISSAVEEILAGGADVGAFLVAEERLRAVVLR